MQSCEEYAVRLMLYLDNELDEAEKTVVEAHLKDCSACREVFNRERWFLECVHKTRPLYVAPAELRERVKAITDAATSSCPTTPSRPKHNGLLYRISDYLGIDNRYSAALAALVLLVIVGFWSVTAILDRPQPTVTLAAMAVDTHQRHMLGQLPLELVTDASEEITNWFVGKVPFRLKLSNYQYTSGQRKLYRLEGARLVGFKDDYAAYVSYQMGSHPISLVVTSSTFAKPSGGEKITSKGLVFHYDTIDGFKVITWSHHGLTYALVSDLEVGGQQSCLVCHQGGNDQDFVKSLGF